MTAPVEGCCHSAKNPRIGERVGVRGLFRVLDCCAGGLGSPGRGILGAKAPKKNSRTHGRRCPGQTGGQARDARQAHTTPCVLEVPQRSPVVPEPSIAARATGERVDGWTVTAPEAPTTIPSRLPTRGVVCAAWRPGHPGGGRPSARTSLHPLREAARDPHACRDQASARRCRPRGVGVDCRRAGRLRSGRMAPGSPRYGPSALSARFRG